MSDMEVHNVRRESETVARRVSSPARFVSGLIGLVLIVMGGVALARTGLRDLTGETASVLGFEHTALMGIIAVVTGLLFVGAAAAATVKAALMSVSLLSIAFGAIVAIEPGAFGDILGGGRDLGLLYVFAGLLGLLAAVAFPTRVVDTEASRHEDSYRAT
jgi:hypothetical protein